MTDLGDREFLLGKTAVKPAHRSKKAMVWPLAFLLVLVWFLYTPLQAGRWFESDPNQSNWTDIRLPTTIVPRHYSVDFELDGSHFAGQVTIQLDISKPTRFLVVHSLDIGTQFKSLSSNISAATPLFTHIEARHKQEYCVLFFDSLIKEGGYVLQLDYNGTLSKSMEGFYESKYRAADGSMRSLATTQFEPTSARRAFPCLDEPEMKAVFEISIIVNTKYHALSNMPVREKKSLPGKTLYSFQPTVKMSSYLIAFIISDFESISKKTKNGILVSVYTPPGKTHLARYALDAAVGMLDYYQSAYGIEFPLPKCDLIAIPDFAAGAMENWGLVTFRDTALLFDPKTSTAGGKERVAEVVAHELAHQWFGNLVTMKWWNDLWLNEGFAEFMEYKAVNSFEPTWKMLETFIPNDLVRALHADESAFTHSIALPVQDPNEISNIFDDISYGKGSSVIRYSAAHTECSKAGWTTNTDPITFFQSCIITLQLTLIRMPKLANCGRHCVPLTRMWANLCRRGLINQDFLL